MLKMTYKENKIDTAYLYMREKSLKRISPLKPSTIDICGYFSPDRQQVEDFIVNVYKEHYNAKIIVNFPFLMSVRNAEGDILAAAGFRHATDETLFLEQYTKEPINKIIDCDRKTISEIGNLASAGKGASIFLFTALTTYLLHKNKDYVTLTGTEYLYKYFKRIGLNPKEICKADSLLLQEDDQNWGSYYDTEPRVIIGSLDKSVCALQKLLGAQYEDLEQSLFTRLHYKSEK